MARALANMSACNCVDEEGTICPSALEMIADNLQINSENKRRMLGKKKIQIIDVILSSTSKVSKFCPPQKQIPKDNINDMLG